ncbi:MAG: hypothetical protein ACI35O_15585 [Bacillaceae bacterium]
MAKKILRRSHSPIFRNIIILLKESIFGIIIFQGIRTLLFPSIVDVSLFFCLLIIGIILQKR